MLSRGKAESDDPVADVLIFLCPCSLEGLARTSESALDTQQELLSDTTASVPLRNGIKRVTLVEVGAWPGVNSSFSNGSIHAIGMNDTEVLQREHSLRECQQA